MRTQIRSAVRRALHSLARTRLSHALLTRGPLSPWEAYLIQDFVHGGHGRAYGVTARDRAGLLAAFERNCRSIESGTSPAIHTVLAREILAIPPEVRGDVVECGCWKGASTASLSLVCGRVGRCLLVCDSFAGLPEEPLTLHVAPHFGTFGYYKKGMFCGALDEVRHNVARCGDIRCCTFIPGFFSESLKTLAGPVAFAFLDVDLVGSTQDCLRALWPLLNPEGRIYTDDAGDADVVRVFFDDAWWQAHLGCRSPGYVGSGCGLPLGPIYSSLGYTQKLPPEPPRHWIRQPHLYYPDQEQA